MSLLDFLKSHVPEEASIDIQEDTVQITVERDIPAEERFVFVRLASKKELMELNALLNGKGLVGKVKGTNYGKVAGIEIENWSDDV
jgi:hypothetical protein